MLCHYVFHISIESFFSFFQMFRFFFFFLLQFSTWLLLIWNLKWRKKTHHRTSPHVFLSYTSIIYLSCFFKNSFDFKCILISNWRYVLFISHVHLTWGDLFFIVMSYCIICKVINIKIKTISIHKSRLLGVLWNRFWSSVDFLLSKLMNVKGFDWVY